MNDKFYLCLNQAGESKELKARIRMNDKILNEYIPSETNRYQHILGVADRMKQLLEQITVNETDKRLLIQAAYLHDIGYSDRLNKHHFHPLDGAIFAQQMNFPKPVIAAVLFHSGAYESVKETRNDLFPTYSLNDDLLDKTDHLFIDLVTYCDLHTSPLGKEIPFEERIQDIVDRYGEHHEVSQSMIKNMTNFKKTIQRVEKLITR
ncbi:HD domain-containing protein [Thermoactinomyces mirandus]|uniref:HD domain-containing protein n=1 Tax=Thermoactinomyces mirandus TaxID=2756294 RepID=A0A7W1XUH5_9BACL|nr:HD domain-containing protein [Thermoactinomyces mirandus]MBA4603287.1 HD domain-containing protein [Thermoactinomyces mirandus]